MPDEYPPFPSHVQALAYLRAYARAFDLYDSVELDSAIQSVRPAGERGWHVWASDDREPRFFDRVIIANGHHWSPLWPTYPGVFHGHSMHSGEFKDPDVLRGKRVLVVGAGNSGCDIAVEAAQHADAAFISVRRGYHFLPKFLRGRPIDSAGIQLQRWRFPLWLRRAIARRYARLILGKPQRFGLPKPDHKLFQTHPIINSQVFYHLGHGRLKAKPDVAHFRGDEVEFGDGSHEKIDLIVFATGFQICFPFIDDELLNWHDGMPRLDLHFLHPRRDDLFVIGMIQPNGGLWPLSELQAKIVARCIQPNPSHSSSLEIVRAQTSRLSQQVGGGIHFIDSPRHRIEVDYFAYRKELARLLQSLKTTSPAEAIGEPSPSSGQTDVKATTDAALVSSNGVR